MIGVVVGCGDIEDPDSKEFLTREVSTMKEAFSAIQELTSTRPDWKIAMVCDGEVFPQILKSMEEES